jgi:ATP-dependent DNA ligase
VLLQPRQQRPLTRYFPDVVAGIVDQLPSGTVLDGVI